MKQTKVIDNSTYQLTVEQEWLEHLEVYRVRFTENHLDDSPPSSYREYFLTQEELMRLKVLAL